MRKPTLGIVSIVPALMACVLFAPVQAAESFIVPGVDFSNLTLEEGAWCRYLVSDEALGQVDTTEIYEFLDRHASDD